MTEPLQVGQFAIVDGEPVDRGPNAGVFHGKGPTDDRAELFLLAEGTTPAGEAFAGHVVSTLGTAFATLDMSLTGSLGRLFIEAERNLNDWNRKSIAQHRVAIGLTSFGRRGEQAVIAQAGPSAAFHFHEGHVTAYSADGPHAQAIGSADVQPQLTKIPFGRGDRLLLVSSPALRELDDEMIAGILALPEEQVLPDLYRRVQGMRQVTVVLVTGPQAERSRSMPTLDEYVIDATGDQEETADENFQPSLFIEDEGESVVISARAHLLEVMPRRAMDTRVPAMIAEVPAPLLRASGESAISISRIAAEGAARAARSRAAVATIVAEAPGPAPRPAWRTPGEGPVAHAVANNSTEEQPPSSSVRTRKNQSFSRGLVSPGAPPTRPEILLEDLPHVAEMAAGQRNRSLPRTPISETLASENGASMAGGAPLVRPRNNMGGRWKGGNSFGHRTSLGSQLPPTWMVIMGALAVLILIAGILTVPRMLEDDQTARVATLVEGAQQRLAASVNQTDPGQKRQMLTEAQAMLLEVRDLGSNAQADELLTQVSGAISMMDNVRQPQLVETVASLEQFGTKPVAVARMTIAEEAAYILDVNSAQVIAVSLIGGQPKVVFAQNKEEKRATPIAIAQLDQSDLGGPVLLIADSANHIYAYSPVSGFRAIAFAAPGNLAISDIAVNGRDLFVLDSAQSVIYRFVQTPEGFPNAPTKVVSSPDLGSARRLMADTEFITTDANGTVHRFLNGGSVAITFSQSGIDRRLVSAETAQPMSNRSEIAVLDAPNDRVVVLRRDGGFDRQYRHPDFAGASAFAIRAEQAYIFSGAQLRRVTF